MAKGRQFLDKIDTFEIEKMIPCFKPNVKKYKKGEKIISYSEEELDEKNMHIGILHHGAAHLEVLNANGDAFDLEHYADGDVFGEIFTLPIGSNEYTVYADSQCSVIYLDYKHVITPCEHVCPHHTQMISNLLIMTAQKTQELSFHLSVLNQKTTREKLLVYLKYIRAQKGAKGTEIFEIPMSLSALAQYICVDRSAMMREIKGLRDDGTLDSERRSFKILI